MIGQWIRKIWIVINNLGQLHTREYKATKKQIVRLQLNEKRSKENQKRLMSWYWKRKLTWRKELIRYNSHPWIMFSLLDSLSFGEDGFRLKLDVQDQGGRKILDVDGQGGWGVLKIGKFSLMSSVYHPYYDTHYCHLWNFNNKTTQY